ncbi:MAG TPA: DUF4411 family protein [Caldilinea sp.]|nr:DUF4411 family protein [Candidatus Competibacteraceae bacterium]HRW50770.1 DUF4411 family protein [Caldilinea sp.]
MLYLLDANVLITANNTYYAIDQVPEFWEWLAHQGAGGSIKMPLEVIEEVKAGSKEDRLVEWIQNDGNHDALLLKEDVDPILVQNVVNNGYANDLTDDEIAQLGRDPFLVAHAMAGDERCVVTTEVSKPSKIRQNRKVPDVCTSLGIECRNTFELTRVLGFRTSWKR